MQGLPFNSLYEINDFFQSWFEISEAKRLEVIRALRKVGKLSTTSSTANAEECVRCPKYKFDLVQPCTLTGCSYHIGSTKYKNCLVNVLQQAKGARVQPQEIANLLSITTGEVTEAHSKALRKIRQTILQEEINQANLPQFHYVPGHCINCEQYIGDELETCAFPHLVIDVAEFGWCSIDCRDAKPRWVFQIERDYKVELVELIEFARNVHIFKTGNTLEDTLGVSPSSLERYIK